jgi:hypothetical protein
MFTSFASRQPLLATHSALSFGLSSRVLSWYFLVVHRDTR